MEILRFKSGFTNAGPPTLTSNIIAPIVEIAGGVGGVKPPLAIYQPPWTIKKNYLGGLYLTPPGAEIFGGVVKFDPPRPPPGCQ